MRLPGNDERLTIYGMTGSGKTNAALWHLSKRNFLEVPWLILDFKGDSHIAALSGTREIPHGGKAPREPGIHIARPLPDADDTWVDDLLWNVWHNGNTGVYTDEAYMIGTRSKPFNALLTQGRSKKIPMITLTQRPVWVSRFVVSEAEFHQVFFLSDAADRDIVERLIPYDIKDQRLERYHSWYYDLPRDKFTGLKPLPKPSIIRQDLNEQLAELEAPKHIYGLKRRHHFI